MSGEVPAHFPFELGMRREAHLHEHIWVRGKWRDSYLYAVLEREWQRSTS